MHRIDVSSWLRWGLGIDCAASATMGLLFVLFPAQISTLFHLPAAGVVAVGSFCLMYAAVIGRMAQRARLPRWSVWAVVIGNALWAVDSVLLVSVDLLSPNEWGRMFILLQAALVFGFAEWQYLGLKRSPDAMIAGVAPQ